MGPEAPTAPRPSAFPWGPAACIVPLTESWPPWGVGPHPVSTDRGGNRIPQLLSPGAQLLPPQQPRSVPLSRFSPKTLVPRQGEWGPHHGLQEEERTPSGQEGGLVVSPG